MPNPSENVALLLTAPGTGAIAVVRLVGPGVAPFLAQHFGRTPQPGRAVHGELADAGGVIDDPVVVLDPQQRFADLNLHGGSWVVQAVLDLAARSGFRVLDGPPPLPLEAVDGESTLEREVLAYLPLARTELAARILLAQPKAWETLRRTPSAYSRTFFRILEDQAMRWLLDPPRVAIVGAPNAGKSTLANQLFGQERSITADLPGTTRDWVGHLANIDGLAVMLVDTPGLRDTTDPIEAESIRRSRQQLEGAELVLLVLDASRPLQPEQEALMQRFKDAKIVVNKVDQPAAWTLRDARSAPQTCATTGSGIDGVRQVILRRFGCENPKINRARCWTDRQREVLLSAIIDPRRLAEI